MATIGARAGNRCHTILPICGAVAAPEWPAFTVDIEAYMELGASLRVGHNLEVPRLDLIGKAWAERRRAGAGDGDRFKAGNRPW